MHNMHKNHPHWLEQTSLIPPIRVQAPLIYFDCANTLVADIHTSFIQDKYLNAEFLGNQSACLSIRIPKLQISDKLGFPTLLQTTLANCSHLWCYCPFPMKTNLSREYFAEAPRRVIYSVSYYLSFTYRN